MVWQSGKVAPAAAQVVVGKGLRDPEVFATRVVKWQVANTS